MGYRDYSKDRSVYWIFSNRGAVDKLSTDEFRAKLESIGLRPYPPKGLGAGGPPEVIREVAIVLISFHEFWVSLIVGVLASRIDKLVGYSIHWFKKQKALQGSRNVKYIAEIYVYRKHIFGKEKFTYVKVDLKNPPSKADIKKVLRSK